MPFVGIANEMELTDRFLPRLRARDCQPQVLIFGPYDSHVLTSILRQRTQTALQVFSNLFDIEALARVLFDAGSIELCARKVLICCCC